MKFLPKIDLTTLPDLTTNLVGMFGRTNNPGHDDSIVVLATIVYETQPPGSGLF